MGVRHPHPCQFRQRGYLREIEESMLENPYGFHYLQGRESSSSLKFCTIIKTGEPSWAEL